MNKTKIDWADYTTNPVTGCLHGCTYCYAARQVKRFSGDIRANTANKQCVKYQKKEIYVLENQFLSESGKTVHYPFGFAPTFHRYRLDWPNKIKNGANIFVCSMADLFGEWVTNEWIEEVLETYGKYPQHNFLFLTKNPNRYEELKAQGKLPKQTNFWYGTTVTGPGMKVFSDSEYNTFVSVEPILKAFTKDEVEKVVQKVDWIIIGAETGKRKEKVIPEIDWLSEFYMQSVFQNKPIFFKDSLQAIAKEKQQQEEFTLFLSRKMFPKLLEKKNVSQKLKAKNYRSCFICGKERPVKEMTTISARRARGETNKAIAYVCHGECEENLNHYFKKVQL